MIRYPWKAVRIWILEVSNMRNIMRLDPIGTHSFDITVAIGNPLANSVILNGNSGSKFTIGHFATWIEIIGCGKCSKTSINYGKQY
jgi:hypothetical protein